MTCIVGYVEGGVVYMGGDSAGVSGYDLTIRSDPKVFRNGDFLIGFTWSFRIGQLLRYSFTPPQHSPDVDIHRYLATAFVDAVRQCLKEGGISERKDEVEHGGCFLVGYRGQLFCVETDYQIAESKYPFDAIGSGRSTALGALYAMYVLNVGTPEEKVTKALQAASRFNITVHDPYVITSLGEK